MQNAPFQYKEIKNVKWEDLTQLTKFQTFIELTISIPWLVGSIWLAYTGYILLALPCSFMFFLTGLRQVHNSFHYALGVNAKLTEAIIFILSLLMCSSMHAVKYNHLMHHKHCLNEQDIEGKSARMSMLNALLFGPIFPLQLHYYAWKDGNSAIRRWMAAELLGIVIFYAILLSIGNDAFMYHFIVMMVGQCLTSFFAVWTVHHDCDEFVIARTINGKWKTILTYSMFYHVEHHLFPKVPTCNLPKLAKRIDEALPAIRKKTVF